RARAGRRATARAAGRWPRLERPWPRARAVRDGHPVLLGQGARKDTFLDFSIEPLYVDWFQKATGEFLGHAVVEVATQEDGEAAVNMINDFEVEGADGPRKLVVRIDTKAPHLAAPRAGG
ncbi:unnamed protein product, partial [Prorocentrum cordatum]